MPRCCRPCQTSRVSLPPCVCPPPPYVCVVLQVDQEPSIRANTTVLLGNIAQYLGDQYCKKVG